MLHVKSCWSSFLYYRRPQEPFRGATPVLGWIRDIGNRESRCWVSLPGVSGPQRHRGHGLSIHTILAIPGTRSLLFAVGSPLGAIEARRE